jgi:hypothetical protein
MNMDEEYKNQLNLAINWAMTLFPLYHGTDMRIIEMAKEERQSLKNDCVKAVDYMWKIFQPYFEKSANGEIKEFKEPLGVDGNYQEWIDLCYTLTNYHAGLEDNEQFKYDSFHLTTSRIKAENYARRSFAFGEIGFYANRMYNAMCKLNLKEWTPDDNIAKILKRIHDFANDKKNMKPAVFEINKLDFNLINIEKEGSIWNLIGKFSNLHDLDLVIHYNGNINLEPSKAIFI